MGRPPCMQKSQEPISPMSWYRGSQLTPTSVGFLSSPAPIARMLASRFAWVSSTPFGWPVLPEVYWMKAVSLPRPSGPEDVAPRPTRSSAVVTSASEGKLPLSKLAMGMARGIVIRTRTAASARIADCRWAYSPRRSRRTGG